MKLKIKPGMSQRISEIVWPNQERIIPAALPTTTTTLKNYQFKFKQNHF